MKNWYWKTQNWGFGTQNLHFLNLMVQLLPIITPLILDQLTCSLPKNVTTFHGKQDGIINFCLIPNWRGVSALLTFKSTVPRSLIDTVYSISFISALHNLLETINTQLKHEKWTFCTVLVIKNKRLESVTKSSIINSWIVSMGLVYQSQPLPHPSLLTHHISPHQMSNSNQ